MRLGIEPGLGLEPRLGLARARDSAARARD